MPEHVYAALFNKSAYLSILPGCFAVWSVQNGDDNRGLMFVWAVEGQGLDEHGPAVKQALNDMAKSMNIKTVRMIGRKGRARDPFWRFAGYVYEHEVA
jgi:hypothetical protein